MITVSSIISDIKASLDSEKTNYWDEVIDIIPAINQSVNWVVTLLESVYGRSKFPEEALYGIQEAVIYTASLKSSISIDFSKYRTILAVSPNPSTIGNGSTAPDTSDVALAAGSVVMTNLDFVEAGDVCARVPLEVWIGSSGNPFVSGNNIVKCNDLISYGYLSVISKIDKFAKIIVRPDVSRKLVVVFLTKVIPAITGVSDVLYLNTRLKGIVIDKALSILTRKDDGKFSLFEVTEDDIGKLFKAFL